MCVSVIPQPTTRGRYWVTILYTPKHNLLVFVNYKDWIQCKRCGDHDFGPHKKFGSHTVSVLFCCGPLYVAKTNSTHTHTHTRVLWNHPGGTNLTVIECESGSKMLFIKTESDVELRNTPSEQDSWSIPPWKIKLKKARLEFQNCSGETVASMKSYVPPKHQHPHIPTPTPVFQPSSLSEQAKGFHLAVLGWCWCSLTLTDNASQVQSYTCWSFAAVSRHLKIRIPFEDPSFLSNSGKVGDREEEKKERRNASSFEADLNKLDLYSTKGGRMASERYDVLVGLR